MRKCRKVGTHQFSRDHFTCGFNGCFLYIAEDSPTNAGNIFEKIKETASSLSHLSDRGRIVPELQDQGIFLYRERILAPWRIVFRVSDKKIYVLSVIDSRQNVEDILLKRLIK